jgi:hypothetical protein
LDKLDMPKYHIPKAAGEFHIRDSKAGTPMVWNGKTSKGKVMISCRDYKHAEEVLEKVQELKNGGELWV